MPTCHTGTNAHQLAHTETRWKTTASALCASWLASAPYCPALKYDPASPCTLTVQPCSRGQGNVCSCVASLFFLWPHSQGEEPLKSVSSFLSVQNNVLWPWKSWIRKVFALGVHAHMPHWARQLTFEDKNLKEQRIVLLFMNFTAPWTRIGDFLCVCLWIQ